MEEIIKKNFNISENNIISVELAKVLGYSLFVGFQSIVDRVDPEPDRAKDAVLSGSNWALPGPVRPGKTLFCLVVKGFYQVPVLSA